MIGKKKASFFILCDDFKTDDDGEQIGPYVKLVEGWTKDGVGYHKINNWWTATDLQSGTAYPDYYETIDDAWDAIVHNSAKVFAIKQTKKYQAKVELFNKLKSQNT